MSTILGISGSPVENSNTDTLVKTMIESSGLELEFVKLSDLNVTTPVWPVKSVFTPTGVSKTTTSNGFQKRCWMQMLWS